MRIRTRREIFKSALVYLLQRYTNANTKICRYILRLTNSMPQISYYSTFHFLRYAHSSYAKCLLQTYRNNRIRWKVAFTGSFQTLLVSNSRILRIKSAKLLEIVLIWRWSNLFREIRYSGNFNKRFLLIWVNRF